ncbi:MAG: LPS assembly lipoprotein LptE, partial [Bacteroidota bacterium]
LSGCGILSVSFNFTGTARQTDNQLTYLFVDVFTNQAQIVVPYLAQEITIQIQDRFLSQSKLALISANSISSPGLSDSLVSLSGTVTRYSVDPVAIQEDDLAAQNRLNISVRVNFENGANPDESWENTFSGFIDFDASEDFASQESDLINEVLEQITQDIFSKSIGKW